MVLDIYIYNSRRGFEYGISRFSEVLLGKFFRRPMNAKNVDVSAFYIHPTREKWLVVTVVVVVVIVVVLEALVYPFKGVRSFSNLFEERNWHLLSVYSLCHVAKVIKAGS